MRQGYQSCSFGTRQYKTSYAVGKAVRLRYNGIDIAGRWGLRYGCVSRRKFPKAVPAGSTKAYAFAAFCVIAIGLFFEGVAPFATFFPAALFAALVGGIGAGNVCRNTGRHYWLVGVLGSVNDFLRGNDRGADQFGSLPHY